MKWLTNHLLHISLKLTVKIGIKQENNSAVPSEDVCIESSNSETDYDKLVDEPYLKIDDYSPVKTKELLNIQLLIQRDWMKRAERTTLKDLATPVKKIRKNLFSNINIGAPGDLNKIEIKNIMLLNPTFASSTKKLKEKDLKMLKKRKEYRILSENNLLKEIRIKDKAIRKKLYENINRL